MRSLSDVRATFIDFFKKQGHTHVSSSPLVPNNDPTLLFTNAGMVQFKDVFTGAEKRPYQRATTSQKCLRAGGKHNDLENVGYTARHHTFFEMLGNFSFGDYFKEDAIQFAWSLVTGDLGLDKEKLLVTVYAEDEEAARLWKKIAGLSDDRIIRIATSDNFWSMGDTGPCGPCTEIFYDHGADIPGGPPGSPDEDGDRFIEIWNLVFMQYEQLADGRRINLPKPSVDTGMGIERIAAVLQHQHNNYDIDLFQDLIQASIELTGASAPQQRQSHNVITDHLRACSFLLADGVMPSNEGRGYVLRRIMRRAMRHAHILGAKEPLMHRLVPRLVELMGVVYPELTRAESMIQENLKLEEEKFRQTLDRGLRLLKEETARLSPSQALPGDVAFKLYDTYGFPLDLTQDVLRAENRPVDLVGFESSMAAQKAAARAAWAGTGDAKNEQVWYDLHEKFGATEFLGYESLTAEAVIQAIVPDSGDDIFILVNQTPFYAESGGQIGDCGKITGANGVEIKITSTSKKVGTLHAHLGRVISGSIKAGDVVHLAVDSENRQKIRANHSATHLLHAALRQVLGDHVTQKGSLVAPDRLRFDFTHTKPMTSQEIKAVEILVNKQIHENHSVNTRLMTPEKAIEEGAMALFGERYGEEVRVLSMGSFSVELCGGTHVRQTGDIGLCHILSENGVSAGVRRIEALTGIGALEALLQSENMLQMVAGSIKSPVADVVQKVDGLLAEKRQLERQVNELKKQLALSGGASNEPEQARQMGKYRLLTQTLQGIEARELKGIVDGFKGQIESGVVVVTSVIDDKVAIVIGVTEDLTKTVSAVDLVRIAAPHLGGAGGGGRADMAQAGGNSAAGISLAISAIETALKAA